MKLRITEPGFKNYTGQMGVVFFQDGLSTTDVSELDATRMSAVMGFKWEDGSAASVAQHLIDRLNEPAKTIEVNTASKDAAAEPAPQKGKQYTQDELAAIADEKGIAGLRAIAEPMNVKGKSINDLIAAILAAAK